MKKIFSVLLILILTATAAYYLLPEKVAGCMLDFARFRAGLVKKDIQIDDHNIVYLEGGKGQAILLLHGYGSEKDTWLFFSSYLTKHYRVIIPDIPGYGESSKLPKASYDLASQLERLRKFTQALQLTRFHIAGSSMGGFFAGSYAARYPDEIISLGLFAAGGVTPLKFSEVYKQMRDGENPLLLKNKDDYDRLMALVFYQPPFLPYPIKYMSIKKALADNSFNAKTLKDFQPEFFSLDKELSKIKAPTLILWGADDKIIDVSTVSVLQKGIINSQAVILENCGHVPMVEKAKESAALYLGFIRSVK